MKERWKVEICKHFTLDGDDNNDINNLESIEMLEGIILLKKPCYET